MGMSIDSMLMVGLNYENLCDNVDQELVDDLLDSGELDYASPHYDSPRSQWFVGVELSNGCPVYDNIFISQEEMKGITDSLDKLLGVKLTYTLRACADVS